MSLFIQRDNQQLLWTIINKNNKINNYFDNETEKEDWFKSMIGYFHENNDEAYNPVQLKSMNTRVLQFMAQNLKNRQYSAVINQNSYSETPDNNQYGLNNETTITNETTMSDYERREQEYRQLLEAPKPKEVNFALENNNQPVSTNDLDMQQKIRERDIDGIKNPFIEENIKMRTELAEIRKEIQDLKVIFEKMKMENTELKKETNMCVRENVSTSIENIIELVEQIY